MRKCITLNYQHSSTTQIQEESPYTTSDGAPQSSTPQASPYTTSDGPPQSSTPRASPYTTSDGAPQSSTPPTSPYPTSDGPPQSSTPQESPYTTSDGPPQSSIPQEWPCTTLVGPQSSTPQKCYSTFSNSPQILVPQIQAECSCIKRPLLGLDSGNTLRLNKLEDIVKRKQALEDCSTSGNGHVNSKLESVQLTTTNSALDYTNSEDGSNKPIGKYFKLLTSNGGFSFPLLHLEFE